MDKPIVFLSHSSKDSTSLNRLKAGLEEKTHGTIDFFLSSDGESIPFGRNWVASVQKALDSAKLAFVFLSPHSVGSGWVHFESGFMYSKGIDVVPLGMPGADLGKIPPPLGHLQGFNLRSHESLNNIFTKLNATFGTKHKDVFSAEDYANIFVSSGLRRQNFFGRYSDLIRLIIVNLEASDPILPELKKVLDSKGIEASYSPSKTSPAEFSTYGMKAFELQPGIVKAEVSPELAGMIFEMLDESCAIVKLKPPVNLDIQLSHNVRTVTHQSTLSGKLYQTGIKFLRPRVFDFNGITFGMYAQDELGSRQRNIINCQVSGKLKGSKLPELVSLLFEEGVLYEEEMTKFDFGTI